MRGWRTVALGELTDPKQWPTLSKAKMQEIGYPVYGANGRIGFTNSFTHERPTILIGCRGSCGTVHVTEPRSYATGNAMALDALDESRADRGFLVHFFRFRGFRDVTTGTSQPQIVRQNLVRLKIPLPSLTEQRRIAEVLDAVDALRERRRTGIGQLNTLTQAVFTDLFADHSTTAKDWATAPLASLATTTSGGTPKRTVADYYGGNVPWVKSGELYQGVVTQTEEYLTARGLAESSAKLMPTGTVLIAMYGATAGVIATLGMPAATNQAVCCVTPGERLNRVFLVHLLKTQTPSLLAKRVGGAQPNLSQDMIRNLLVPLPPLALQGEFARIADAIEDLTALHRSSLVELDELFSSLQHRAFRGEL